MKIRLATNCDIPSILRIVKTVVPLMEMAQNFQWDEFYPLEEHFLDDVLKSQLWVCESKDNNDIAGFAALTEDQPPEYAHVGCDVSDKAVVPHRMAVDPLYQRKGVALLFLTKAEELSKERGYKYVRIDTNSCNTNMQKLIPKGGYTFKGECSLPGKIEGLKYYCYEKIIS